MPRHYFFSSSASRPIVLEGRTYKFVSLSILGGRISGVFDSDDPEDVAILQRAVTRKVGISEISEAEAEKAGKALRASRQPSIRSSHDVSKPRLARSSAGELLPGIPIDGAGSAEFAGKKADAQPTGEITMPRVMSMVRVGHVKPPQPFADGERLTIRGKK